MTIILIGAIIVIIGGLISAIGTFKHNKNSSVKSDRIEKGVLQTDLTVSAVKVQNESLIIKLEKQSETIDKLRQENIELSSRLSEKANSIYDINKAIKFPLPSEILISYRAIFKLEKRFQKEADLILNANYKFQDGFFGGIDVHHVEKFLNWNASYNWVNVYFLKDYKEDQLNSLIIGFTNSNTIRNKPTKKVELFYNATEKKFLMEVEDELLYREHGIMGNLTMNLVQTSISNLANSTMQFSQIFPENVNGVEISHFKVSSKELNLHFWSLKAKNNWIFLGDVELSYIK